MPIKPENRARYPPDWPEISRRIRFERAGGRCECRGECGIDHAKENDAYGFCLPGYVGYPDEQCNAAHGRSHHVTGSIVVLTVAHLDHQPENCAEDNLRAMCQRCHLAYDAEQHAQTWRMTQRCHLTMEMFPEAMG